ncbi:MAG TPA: substrate-binding domain-containing protein [Gemmatimonadaceae bacterium]|nr:substrate-binding domain-containing protein [Gemmatimonadaceae bacterium]
MKSSCVMRGASANVVRRASALAIAALAFAAACTGGSKAANTKQPLSIAVIPKGTSHEFWKSIHAGAVQAAQELSATGDSVQIIWKGPLREDDREMQMQVVEGFISQGVQGLVLAPLDRRALVRPVEEARKAGVPTVIIDSGLETDSIVSYIATDNYKGGELAADRLGQVLGGKGNVLALRLQEGSQSTEERERGFLDRLKSQFPGIKVVSSDQYGGSTRETAKRASENLLNRFGGDLQGIFTPNESTTIGMLLALQDMGKAGKIKFVGFDASQMLVDAMRSHQLDGIAVQNPMAMGYYGVKTMVARLRGQPIEKRIDTGVTMVTPETLDLPEMQKLISPPIAKYLGSGT